MPKCPACLAGYLALITGVGVSTGFAAGLKVIVAFVTLAALFLFAVRRIHHYKKRRS
jgi:MYXO-CTERM domain-containing protein